MNFIGPRKDLLRESLLTTKVAPLILRWSEGERFSVKEGQKAVLSPKRKWSREQWKHSVDRALAGHRGATARKYEKGGLLGPRFGSSIG